MKARVCSRLKEMNPLTGDVLARPAKDLPLKVIRDLGHMLHRAQYNSGNWETIAEDLGYGYEEIKQFNTMANVRQEVAPGELMLRDWVQRINGRTLFVLHSALVKAERLDCVEYLESEIYKRIVCMDLMICVKYEDGRNTDHVCVTTCAESNLLNSLQRVLDQPVLEKYTLLDSGVSWTGTLAKEFKGRQLMLMRNNDVVRMEQDPTVDSSGIDVSEMDETCLTTSHEISVTSASVGTSHQTSATSASIRTSQIFVNQLTLGTSQPNMLTATQNHQERIRRSEPDIHFQNTQTTRQGPILAGNFVEMFGDYSVRSTTPPKRGFTYRAQSMQEQILHGNQTNRLVHSSNRQPEHCTRHNNLNIPSHKVELNCAQKNLNIILNDRKIQNVITGMEVSEGNSDIVKNSTELDNASAEDIHSSNELPTSMECNTDVDFKEGRDIGEYKDHNKCRDCDMIRSPLNKDKKPDINENNELVQDNKSMEHKISDICNNENFREVVAYSDFDEYRDPNEYKDPGEYRGPNEYRDPNEYTDPNEYKDPNGYRDPNEYRDPDEYRDPNEFRDPSGYRDPNEYREYRDPDVYRDPNEYRDPDEYRSPSLFFDLSENKDLKHCKCHHRFEDTDKNRLCGVSSGYNDANAIMLQAGSSGNCNGLDNRDPNESKRACDLCVGSHNKVQLEDEDRFISEGFDTKNTLLTDTRRVEINADLSVKTEFVAETNNELKNNDVYQYAREEFHCSDDSITHLKQKFCSKDTRLTNTNDGHSTVTSLGVNESQKSCNINYQGALENFISLSDFESDAYNAHPKLPRDFSSNQTDICQDGDCNGNIAFKKDSELAEGCKETRVYLDFNKYYQGNTHTKEENLQERIEVVEETPVIETQSDDGRDDFQACHRPPAPRRFISVAPGTCTSSNMARERQMYERLHRGVSCPSDITYEKSLAFLDEKQIVTIADVFSPVTEESKIADFDMASSIDDLRACSSSDSIDSLSSKRHSLPIFRKEENAKRTKLQRHTIHHGDKSVRFLDRSEERFQVTVRDSPPLPPRGQLPNLKSGNTLARSGSERSNTDSTLLTAEEQLISGYVCKIVIGGKSSRSTLDNLLADDKLFTHYNTLLHNFPGWSPRETEHTIEKTMADTLSTDGYYILWYIRARKSLVVSVRRELVNYRVHTKVLSGKLHYYITYGRYFEDIIQLLQHYLQYGVRAPGYENSQSGLSGYRIPLSCPVFVQYEKKLAVSV